MKKLIYIIVAIILLLLFNNFIRKSLIGVLGGYTEKETTIVTDTTYIKGKVDTIAVFNHYVKTKGIKLNKKDSIIYKWVYKNPVSKKEEVLDSVRSFSVKIKDSLIDGSIFVKNDFKGNLLLSDLVYKPLYPKYIKQTDTLKITKIITNTISNERTKFGIGISGNTLGHIGALGSITTKKDWQFIYEYNKNINIIPSINIKDFHSVKIIKSF